MRRTKNLAPEIPADDACEPALVTPRRLASQVQRAAHDLTDVAFRLRALAAYVDSQKFDGIAERIERDVSALGSIAGEILTGKIPITAGRDEAAGKERYPLIEGAAAKTGEQKGTKDAKGSNGRPDHHVKPRAEEPAAPLSILSLEEILEAEADADGVEVDPEAWRLTLIDDDQVELTDQAKAELKQAGIVTAGQLQQRYDRETTPEREAFRLKHATPQLEARIAAVKQVLGRLRNPAPSAPPAEAPKTAQDASSGKRGPTDDGTPEGRKAIGNTEWTVRQKGHPVEVIEAVNEAEATAAARLNTDRRVDWTVRICGIAIETIRVLDEVEANSMATRKYMRDVPLQKLTVTRGRPARGEVRPYGWSCTIEDSHGAERTMGRVTPHLSKAKRWIESMKTVVSSYGYEPLTKEQYHGTFGRKGVRA